MVIGKPADPRLEDSEKRPEVVEETPLANSLHEVTLKWLESNSGILDAFVGEWVAIEGTTIVAHNASVRIVTEMARRQGFDDSLLIPVSSTPNLVI